MPDQGGGWRRNLVRQQTELNRLHGRPPCTVTSVQLAPLEYCHGQLYRTKGAEQPVDNGPGKPAHI